MSFIEAMKGLWYYGETALISNLFGAGLAHLLFVKILFEDGDPAWWAMAIFHVVFAMMFATLAVYHDMTSHPAMFKELTGYRFKQGGYS